LRARVEEACGALVTSRLREYKERHYSTWLDESSPALGGKTPRQAVRTKSGREAVEVILESIENTEARMPAESRFDVGVLRRELGLPAG
jgi:hypothetical protein